MDRILLLNDINIGDSKNIGRLGINISILHKKRLNVPPTFVITKQLYLDYMEQTQLNYKISKLLNEPNNNSIDNSLIIKKLILDSEFPEDLREEIIDAYYSLSFDIDSNDASSLLKVKEENVILKCSLLDNRVKEKEFILDNVKGESNLLDSIKKAFIIPFSQNNIENPLSIQDGITIIIQRKINPEKSGIVLTINENNNKEMLIKTYKGEISDFYQNYTYIVDKYTLEAKNRDSNLLESNDIMEISRTAKRIEGFMGNPQEIFWKISKNKLYLLQTGSINNENKIEEPDEIKLKTYDKEEDYSNVEIEAIDEVNNPIIDIDDESTEEEPWVDEIDSSESLDQFPIKENPEEKVKVNENNIEEDIEFLEIIEKEEQKTDEIVFQDNDEIKDTEVVESNDNNNTDDELSIFSSLKESKPTFDNSSEKPDEDPFQKTKALSKEILKSSINAIFSELHKFNINDLEELKNSDINNKYEILHILSLQNPNDEEIPNPKDIERALNILNQLKNKV